MEFWKDITPIVESVLTSAAIILGGVWAILRFALRRLGFPSLNPDVTVSDILVSGYRFVHVEVGLMNTGSVVVTPNYAELRLRKVLPIPNEVWEQVKAGREPVQLDKTEIGWPMIVGREWRGSKGELEIEPGESDSLHFDFVIDGTVKVAEFYFYLKNPRKEDIGWTVTRIHEFEDKEDI